MVKKKFIDSKQSQKFTLVHRSQQDPLIASEEASKMVFRPMPPSKNLLRSGKWDLSQEPIFQDKYDDDDEYGQHLASKDKPDDGAPFELTEDFMDEIEQDLDDNGEVDDDEDDNLKHHVQNDSKQKGIVVHALKNNKNDVEPEDKKIMMAGEAAKFGIFFEDQDTYDYLKHLKPVGEDPNAILVNSSSSKKNNKSNNNIKKKNNGGGIQFLEQDASEALDLATSSSAAALSQNQQQQKSGNDPTMTSTSLIELPQEVMASRETMKVGMLNKGATDLHFDLGMDPELKEILTALNDDAYVEDDLEDDFFDALNANEISQKVKTILEPDELALEEEEGYDDFNDGDDWMKEFNKFKKQQQKEHTKNFHMNNEDDDDDSIDDSRAAFSDDDSNEDRYRYRTGPKTSTTNFSMSSSAMFRNEQLTLLDDRFDQLLEKVYENDDDLYDDENQPEYDMISQQRIDKVFNEFLENTQVHNHKPVDRLSLDEGMDMIRKGLSEGLSLDEEKERMYRIIEGEAKEQNESEFVQPEKKVRDTWDCETIISTYSNFYNRPKILQDRNVRKITLGRDGMPIGAMAELRMRQKERFVNQMVPDHEEEQDEQEVEQQETVNRGEARPKSETKEEKKLRKEAMKQEKRERREQKKSTKLAFEKEKQKQSKTISHTILQERTISMS